MKKISALVVSGLALMISSGAFAAAVTITTTGTIPCANDGNDITVNNTVGGADYIVGPARFRNSANVNLSINTAGQSDGGTAGDSAMVYAVTCKKGNQAYFASVGALSFEPKACIAAPTTPAPLLPPTFTMATACKY